MKKFLKSLLFVCSINVAAFSDLHLDEYYFTDSCIGDTDREDVQKCMQCALNDVLALDQSYTSRFAQFLIQKDLEQETSCPNMFSYSIYDEIYFDVLQSINHAYNRILRIINMKKSIMCRDRVAAYYMKCARDEINRRRSMVTEYLGYACKEKSRYTRVGEQFHEEDLVLNHMKQDLNHLKECHFNECAECKAIIDNLNAVVSNVDNKSVDRIDDIIRYYKSLDNENDDIIGDIIGDYESSDNERIL